MPIIVIMFCIISTLIVLIPTLDTIYIEYQFWICNRKFEKEQKIWRKKESERIDLLQKLKQKTNLTKL